MSTRRFSLVLLGAAVALAPACIEADIKTTLSKDGSGTMSMHMGLTEGMVAALTDMQKIDPDSDMISESREVMMTEPDEATRAAMKAAGCEVLEFDGEQSETKIYSKFKVAFSHLSKLSELDSMRPEGSEPGDGPGQEMMLVKNDDGTYTLSMTGPGDDDDDEFEDENPFAESPDGDESGDDGMGGEAEEEDPADAMKKAAAAMEVLGKVMAEASKLKIVVGMDVPGEVVSHVPEKGAKVEGGSVVWTFDFATMMAEDMGGGAGGMDGPFSVTFRMPDGESLPESALHAGPATTTPAERPVAPEKK